MTPLKNSLISSVLDKLTPYTSELSHAWFPQSEFSFTIRPLDMQVDLPVIYEWVNQSYAIPFWQMNGSFQNLEETYQTIKNSLFADSLVGCLNSSIVCQVDLYDPFSDPLRDFYQPLQGDLGFHLLMAPGKKPVKNFTVKIVWLFLHLFFQSPVVQRIVGESDEGNQAANRMLQKLSFQFIQRLEMPHKNAHFYTLSRALFNTTPPPEIS